MIIVPKNRVIYSFDTQHRPVEFVEPGEAISLKTEDAFGGQVTSGNSVTLLDWSKVDGATGPIFVKTAEVGDTLIAEILDVSVENRGVIVTVPKCGILKGKKFRSSTKVVELSKDFVYFDDLVRVKSSPMIGTIGVTPESRVSTGSLGRHGGNMDVKEVRAGARLYLPVFVKGALFAAGDLHAVQADGELCVSAIEVAGEILLRFRLQKARRPEWPILETSDSYAILACGRTLDEAAKFATEAVIRALMREHGWSFEKAYMFASLAADLKINQVVDLKKGVRAVVSKDFLSLEGLLA
jgi:amidase